MMGPLEVLTYITVREAMGDPVPPAEVEFMLLASGHYRCLHKPCTEPECDCRAAAAARLEALQAEAAP